MSRKCDMSMDLDKFCNNSDMRLCGDNRWVILREAIPWQELCGQNGSESGDRFRELFAACLIEAHYGLNDEQTIMQIQESPYLQYFCGMDGYNGAAAPIDKDELSRFRAGLDDGTLEKIRRIIGQR